MKCRVRAVVFDGEKLLLVKHKAANGTPYNTWALPGGGLDEGESLTEALTREMVEETGIEPEIGRLLYVHQFSRGGQFEGPEFFFAVSNYEDYQNMDLAKTTHGATEIAEIGFYDTKTLTGLLPDFLYGLTPGNAPEHPRLVIRDEI